MYKRQVLDIVHAFERVTGSAVPYKIVGRRSGAVPASYSDPAKAKAVLGWQAQRDLEDMCRDTWRWQKNNPNGYNE